MLVLALPRVHSCPRGALTTYPPPFLSILIPKNFDVSPWGTCTHCTHCTSGYANAYGLYAFLKENIDICE